MYVVVIMYFFHQGEAAEESPAKHPYLSAWRQGMYKKQKVLLSQNDLMRQQGLCGALSI